MITIDSNQVLIERFERLAEVQTSRIVVYHHEGKFIIEGSSLKVKLFCKDEMLIQGKIESVRLVRNEKNQEVL